MYDRKYYPAPTQPTRGLRRRIETLVGITGVKMYKYRVPILTAMWRPLETLLDPRILLASLFMGARLVSDGLYLESHTDLPRLCRCDIWLVNWNQRHTSDFLADAAAIRIRDER